MKQNIIKQCVKILYRDWDHDKSRERFHYAFAIKKNQLIAIGKNQPDYFSYKIYELARLHNVKKWLKYPFPHAESDLVTKLPVTIKPKDIEILSLRINRHGQFRLAKPCVHCQQLLDSVGINKVTWSCNDSEYWGNELIIQSQNKIDLTESLSVNNLTGGIYEVRKPLPRLSYTSS